MKKDEAAALFADELTLAVAHAINSNTAKDGMKMRDIAAHAELVAEGESVGSSTAAKIRLRIGKLRDAGLVRSIGAKATMAYFPVGQKLGKAIAKA